jgi:hypothetical protein
MNSQTPSLAELSAQLETARANLETFETEVNGKQAELTAAVEKLRTDWEARNAELLKNVADAMHAVAEADKAYRRAIVAAYNRSDKSSKQVDPALGAGVRVNLEIGYDEARAMAWAKGSAPICILTTFDRTCFEKLVRGFIGKARGQAALDLLEMRGIDFVTLGETATAIVGGSESKPKRKGGKK